MIMTAVEVLGDSGLSVARFGVQVGKPDFAPDWGVSAFSPGAAGSVGVRIRIYPRLSTRGPSYRHVPVYVAVGLDV